MKEYIRNQFCPSWRHDRTSFLYPLWGVWAETRLGGTYRSWGWELFWGASVGYELSHPRLPHLITRRHILLPHFENEARHRGLSSYLCILELWRLGTSWWIQDQVQQQHPDTEKISESEWRTLGGGQCPLRVLWGERKQLPFACCFRHPGASQLAIGGGWWEGILSGVGNQKDSMFLFLN